MKEEICKLSSYFFYERGCYGSYPSIPKLSPLWLREVGIW